MGKSGEKVIDGHLFARVRAAREFSCLGHRCMCAIAPKRSHNHGCAATESSRELRCVQPCRPRPEGSRKGCACSLTFRGCSRTDHGPFTDNSRTFRGLFADCGRKIRRPCVCSRRARTLRWEARDGSRAAAAGRR
eukprot:6181265-Pleurochrysis_carterae.AAC.2